MIFSRNPNAMQRLQSDQENYNLVENYNEQDCVHKSLVKCLSYAIARAINLIAGTHHLQFYLFITDLQERGPLHNHY